MEEKVIQRMTMCCSTGFPLNFYSLRPLPAGVDPSSIEEPPSDVRILTSGGLSIPAHSSILASVSIVLEKILDRPSKRRSSEKIIPILGVPCDAVIAFVRFLYSSSCTKEEIGQYGIHLLVLSHVYSVPQLKQRSARGLADRLTVEDVVDVLQLARLCDAPDLYVKCIKFVTNAFNAVEKTDGWKLLQDHDPWLELEILRVVDGAESRQKRRSKIREEQSLYLQLSEAMECLEHICKEGCTSVGPHDIDPSKNRGPCNKFATCRGLQLLIRHFATCKKRAHGRCCRCKRMWQLLRLHSSICEQPDLCKVPLCRQFKLRMQVERNGDNARWRLLARKVVFAKVMSSLSLPKRKRDEATMDDGVRCFRLL